MAAPSEFQAFYDWISEPGPYATFGIDASVLRRHTWTKRETEDSIVFLGPLGYLKPIHLHRDFPAHLLGALPYFRGVLGPPLGVFPPIVLPSIRLSDPVIVSLSFVGGINSGTYVESSDLQIVYNEHHGDYIQMLMSIEKPDYAYDIILHANKQKRFPIWEFSHSAP